MAVFHTGSSDLVSALAYGDPHPNTQRFIDSLIYKPIDVVSEASRHLIEQAITIRQDILDGDTARMIRAAARQVSSLWDRDEIRYLPTIGKLQTAPPKMVRWLMAEPNTRREFHAGRCEGYGEHYQDAEPGKIGETHRDYRIVMDGMVYENDQGELWVDQYTDDEVDGEINELTFEEKWDITRSWQHLADFMSAKGEDPTSRWNSEL